MEGCLRLEAGAEIIVITWLHLATYVATLGFVAMNLRQVLVKDIEKWKRVVKGAGIKL